MVKREDVETVAEGQTTSDDEEVVSLRHTALDGARYATIEEIGRGGMGEVTLCLDRRIGRRVALKRTRPGTNVERFVREACIQGQLEHPTVVPLYDMNVDAGETSFTMKRVRGRTLKAILGALASGDEATAARFTLPKLLGDFASVCLGVAFAHDRGVIHRDLKPDNVMLGDYGEVYVLDWGVAKVADAPPLHEEPLDVHALGHATVAGSIIGTPGYMSPEQSTGDTDRVDSRTDVYALGTILFEILTLERLHRGKTLEALVESTLAGGDAEARLRASTREVAPELAAACLRAIAIDANERFASARELHESIEKFLHHDRNLELRRTLAEEHARAASRATDRTVALSEAGRALALDPTNADAQRVVLRLLTEPPKEIPPEAQRQLDESFDDQRRSSARDALWLFFLFATFAPPLLLMGIRSWPMFVALLAAITVFFLIDLGTSRMKVLGNRMPLILSVVAAVTNTLAALIFGPLVATPSLAIMGTATLIVQLERHRWLVFLLGAVPMVAPLVAAQLGVVPASYTFSDGVMHIHPILASFDPVWSIVLLLAINFTGLIAAAHLGWRIRSNLREAERKLAVQAWQLRQLLPHGAR